MTEQTETIESVKAELQAVKRALWEWANSKTYTEGCANWRRLTALLGYDVATDEKIERTEK